jgi:NAD-dependent SIR2 family protein deacetylase
VPVLDESLAFLGSRPLVVLTGAGLSTDSGIPDYRGAGSSNRNPMTYGDFVAAGDVGVRNRQRYWARSHLGWQRMGVAVPNAGHRAVVAIDPELLITQNVDGLHEAAGSRRVIALHGRVREVICLSCGTLEDRRTVQGWLDDLNPGWAERHLHVLALPDGDVALEATEDFVVPECPACGGALKPHVVFFGESADKAHVAACFAAVDSLTPAGGVLLVAGSSLTVMSGLRFVRRAAKIGVPVVIVNRGTTRGDELATYKLEVGTSEFLVELAARRSATAPSPDLLR